MASNAWHALRRLWRTAPEPLRAGVFKAAYALGVRPTVLPPQQRAPATQMRPGPIVVSGLHSDARGVGEAARLAIAALEAAGLPVLRHDVTAMMAGDAYLPPPAPEVDGGVWLIHLNPREALRLLDRCPLARLPLYRIGVWAWETPKAPRAWLSAAEAFHEVWGVSRFVAEALEGADTTVRTMTTPIPDQGLSDPAPGRPVVFAHVCDLRSGFDRKNPLGVVSAYRSAFPEAAQTARLRLKLGGAEAAPGALAELQAAVADRSDIEIVAGERDAAWMDAFMADTSVMVSLHRAEGFGLPIAQAMAAGRAIIATGWSGPLDFVRGEASEQLVGFDLRAVADRSGHYTEAAADPAQVWAEPNEAQAAELMRQLAADPALRQRLGDANRLSVAVTRAPWTTEALGSLPFAAYVG